MQITRRGFTTRLAALAGVAAATVPGAAWTQDRLLKILVGYAPGGAADTVARIVGDALRDGGYTAVVDNKAGAAGRLAIEALLAAPADGATLLLTPLGNLTLQPHVTRQLRYDPLKDLVGVGSASGMSFALAVGARSPARTLDEFLKMARGNSALAAYGTPGPGTAMHFLGSMLGKDARLPLTHVPYRGGAAALTDAVSGVLPAIITTTPNLLPMHRAGKLRILAISEAAPNAALPDVPTFRQLGYPDLVIGESFAFFARAGTPTPVIATLNQAINNAVRQPRALAQLQQAEFEPRTTSPGALDNQVRAEFAQWARAVKAAGYTPEE